MSQSVCKQCHDAEMIGEPVESRLASANYLPTWGSWERGRASQKMLSTSRYKIGVLLLHFNRERGPIRSTSAGLGMCQLDFYSVSLISTLTDVRRERETMRA